MQLIQTVTVGSGGAASIVFGSGGTLPTTFTDLLIVISARGTRSNTDDNIRLSLNGSTSNFSSRWLYGQGSSASSGTETNYAGQISAATSTASTHGSVQIYIPNYRSSVAKSYSVEAVTENNATFSVQVLIAGLWNDTSAINMVALSAGNGNLAEFSSASLYGITAGSSGGVVVS